MKIRHTKTLSISRENLASLLEDAFQQGSVREDSFNNWDDMKEATKEFQDRMSHVAATITLGPDTGFPEALRDHMTKFDPHAAGYPASKIEVTLRDRHGSLNVTFDPTPSVRGA